MMREVWGFRVFWARSDCEGVRASLPSMKPFYTPRADSLQVVKLNSTVSLDEGSVRDFFFEIYKRIPIERNRAFSAS